MIFENFEIFCSINKSGTNAKKIKRICLKKNIEFKIDYDEHEVANLLSETKVMVLLYPDGVSFRRGTFLASLGNGCEVITTKRATIDEKIGIVTHNINEINKISNDDFLTLLEKSLFDRAACKFHYHKLVNL